MTGRRRLPRSRRLPLRLPVGVGRNVLVLGFVSLFTDIGSEMLYAVVPLYLTSVLGASMTVVGFIEGAAESTASLLKLASGWASDRWRRRVPFVVAGYSLSALSRPLLALASTWPGVLGARIVDRTGKGLRGPARDALIASSTPAAHRGTAFGFHRALDTVGAVIGPLLGFIAIGYLGVRYRTLFWLAGLPSIAAVACLLALRVPGPRPGAHSSAAPASAATSAPLSSALRRYLVVTALFSLGNSSNVFVLLRARDLGWAEQQVIGLYVLYNAVYAIAAMPAGRLSDRLGRRLVVAAGLATFGLVYVGLALASTPLAAAALLMAYGLYSAMLGSAGRALVADLSDEDNRARAMGAYQAVTGAMLLLASPIAGFLWSRIGPAAPFWFGAVTAMGATALFLRTGTIEEGSTTAPNGIGAGREGENGGADGS